MATRLQSLLLQLVQTVVISNTSCREESDIFYIFLKHESISPHLLQT